MPHHRKWFIMTQTLHAEKQEAERMRQDREQRENAGPEKICPDCGAEYLPYIETCGDCGTQLVPADEVEAAREARQRAAAEAGGDAVVIEKGGLDWLIELREVLKEDGIPCAVVSEDGCGKGCCGDTCLLVVPADTAERALQRVTAYREEVHPELRESREMIEGGRCPACGSAVGAGTRTCPDCGLPLMILED